MHCKIVQSTVSVFKVDSMKGKGDFHEMGNLEMVQLIVVDAQRLCRRTMVMPTHSGYADAQCSCRRTVLMQTHSIAELGMTVSTHNCEAEVKEFFETENILRLN